MSEPGQAIELETVACNLCGGMNCRELFQKRGHLTGHPFTVVRCEHCRLVFVNPRLSAKAIKDLYDEAYFEGAGFDPFVGLEQETQKVVDAARALERIGAVKPPPADVLEVGPGRGTFLRMAGQAGYRSVGLDLSDYAAARLAQQGLSILHGTIDTAGIDDASFDVVVAVEVLEHLLDPKAFLREAARVLRPGGLLYYETGDSDCEEARRQGPNWDYIRPEGHLYYFSPRVLHRYLRETGFAPCYPAWFNPTRTVVRALARLHLLDRTRPVMVGWRTSLPRRLLAVWDCLPERWPYPMAIRR